LDISNYANTKQELSDLKEVVIEMENKELQHNKEMQAIRLTLEYI